MPNILLWLLTVRDEMSVLRFVTSIHYLTVRYLLGPISLELRRH